MSEFKSKYLAVLEGQGYKPIGGSGVVWHCGDGTQELHFAFRDKDGEVCYLRLNYYADGSCDPEWTVLTPEETRCAVPPLEIPIDTRVYKGAQA